MITEKIHQSIREGMAIPKPEAVADFVVKGWGRRRGEAALIYRIPNYRDPTKPYEKGITQSELERAFAELQRSGAHQVVVQRNSSRLRKGRRV